MRMSKEDARQLRWDPDEFDKNAVDATEFKAVTAELIAESTNALENESQRTRNEDWSILANQVVGAERLKDFQR